MVYRGVVGLFCEQTVLRIMAHTVFSPEVGWIDLRICVRYLARGIVLLYWLVFGRSFLFI